MYPECVATGHIDKGFLLPAESIAKFYCVLPMQST
jgi:hypothetical protein